MHHHDAGCFVHTYPFFRSMRCLLTMLVCATRGLSMHLYTLAYMSIYESCLLMCHPCFNTMKLWTFDPNQYLSIANTTFRLLSCFVLFIFLLVFPLACLCAILFVCYLFCSFACIHAMLAISILLVHFASICYYLRIFLPLLVYWFLVFSFACTHME